MLLAIMNLNSEIFAERRDCLHGWRGPTPKIRVTWPAGSKVTAASVIDAYDKPARRRRTA
jgi:hypothetical protein